MWPTQIHRPVTVSSLSGGTGTASELHVSQDVEDVDVEIILQQERDMTLAEEREYEIIKGGLTYKEEDAHTPTPHWNATYPWIQPVI